MAFTSAGVVEVNSVKSFIFTQKIKVPPPYVPIESSLTPAASKISSNGYSYSFMLMNEHRGENIP